MKVNLNDRELQRLVESHPQVTAERLQLARRVSTKAAARTKTGRTGKAKASHRVEDDRSRTPPFIACVAGEGAFWYVFQEFGGVGFRPAPAPLRSTAKSEGLRVDPRVQGDRKRRR